MLGRMSNGASATYTQSPVTRKKWRGRSYVSLLLFIIATLLTPIAVIGHWGHETIANPEQYINTVGPLAEDPEIQQAVSETVSDAIIEKVDTSQVASGLVGVIVPNEALSNLLSGPIKAGIDGLIRGAVDKFVTSDAFQEAWIRINELAQKAQNRIDDWRKSGVVARRKAEEENREKQKARRSKKSQARWLNINFYELDFFNRFLKFLQRYSNLNSTSNDHKFSHRIN